MIDSTGRTRLPDMVWRGTSTTLCSLAARTRPERTPKDARRRTHDRPQAQAASASASASASRPLLRPAAAARGPTGASAETSGQPGLGSWAGRARRHVILLWAPVPAVPCPAHTRTRQHASAALEFLVKTRTAAPMEFGAPSPAYPAAILRSSCDHAKRGHGPRPLAALTAALTKRPLTHIHKWPLTAPSSFSPARARGTEKGAQGVAGVFVASARRARRL